MTSPKKVSINENESAEIFWWLINVFSINVLKAVYDVDTSVERGAGGGYYIRQSDRPLLGAAAMGRFRRDNFMVEWDKSFWGPFPAQKMKRSSENISWF